MQYQDDYILRLVEQLGSMMRLAFSRFREGQSSSEPLDVTNQAIQMIVDVGRRSLRAVLAAVDGLVPRAVRASTIGWSSNSPRR